jgi:beta-lactamase regulating signal transducer with metallopeptidase domain
MNGAFVFRDFVLLGECVVMATAILLVARLATMLVARNAALRHLIWLIAFCSLLVTPALVACLPTLFVLHVPRAAGTTSSSALMAAPPAPAIAPTDADDARSGLKAGHGFPIVEALFGVWLAGLAVVAAMGFTAAYRIRGHRCNSGEHAFHSLDLCDVSARIGLRRPWRLRVSSSEDPQAAMTWGVLHPVILLPKKSVSWTKDRLEAVLLHELAHIRRCDSLSQWLAFVVCAVYWFHPAVWRFVRLMRADAELAADDAVLGTGIKASAYAALLLRFAAELGPSRAPMMYAGVSFLRQSRIATRIDSILNRDQRERGVTPLQAGKTVGISLAAVFLLAALRPSVSLADVSSSVAEESAGRVVERKTTNAESLPPALPKTDARSIPAAPLKSSPAKRCHKKDAALKKSKTQSAG